MKLIMVFASCAIAIIYMGVVFGIIMMCESMPELHRVKKYASSTRNSFYLSCFM